MCTTLPSNVCSGSYVFMAPQEKYTISADILARTFPGSTIATPNTPSLSEFSVAVQEQMLLRELMWALSGVEVGECLLMLPNAIRVRIFELCLQAVSRIHTHV